MSIACPRCAVTLHLAPLGARDAHEPFVVGRCGPCGGLWVDRDDLRRAEPMLDQIPLHSEQAMRAETRFGGIPRCPRCASVPVSFPFFEVLIDWCGACGGVWLDAGELDDLRASVARVRREGAAHESTRHFRQQAASAVVIGTVRCARCRAAVPLADAWMTGDGAVCAACGHEERYGVTAATVDELAAMGGRELRGPIARALAAALPDGE